jgi:ribose/xylose/arabinose/galactoside ABC-type transport system permease subunit
MIRTRHVAAAMADQRVLAALLNLTPLLFFVAAVGVFARFSDRFLSAQNALNILLQSSALAVMAVGASFVLLIGGIDLSIGAAIYVVGVVVGMYLAAAPAWVALSSAVVLGGAFGALNGLFIVKLRAAAFMTTIAMMFIDRGFGLFLSDTRGVLASAQITDLARVNIGGAPLAVIIAAAAIGGAAFLLRATPFGLHVYAIGADREGARRAGIDVDRTIFTLYVLCGAFAALGGFILMFQVGFVSSSFGDGDEFLALAAAVLGGVSLLGGRGRIWGAGLGAVLIQTVQNGLEMTGADPYVYPLVIAGYIFVAVLIDIWRARTVARIERRRIMPPDPIQPRQRLDRAAVR